VIGAEIMGQVYEQFLGKVIRLTAGHRGRQAMGVFRDVTHEHETGVIIVTHDHRTLEVFDSIYEMGDGNMFRGGRPPLRRSAGRTRC
jgi:energy-coupling factor transporter ATP-binding protein EcfA2